jgi:hypothetical protein
MSRSGEHVRPSSMARVVALMRLNESDEPSLAFALQKT